MVNADFPGDPRSHESQRRLIEVDFMPSFQTSRRVEFCDTDMAGIVHFANFFRYMEAAEHELFRNLGLKSQVNSPTAGPTDGRACLPPVLISLPPVTKTCSKFGSLFNSVARGP